MNDITEKTLPPVRIHFSDTSPLETRCLTEEGEIAIMEILKVEYGLEDEPDDRRGGHEHFELHGLHERPAAEPVPAARRAA